jgi:uncharacterized membrane protein (UPF0127 family)
MGAAVWRWARRRGDERAGAAMEQAGAAMILRASRRADGRDARVGARLRRLPATDLGGGLLVHEARGRGARRRGLGGLDALPGDRALRLRCRAVHTFTMRFALDLIWLDRAGRVVRADRHATLVATADACAPAAIETRAGLRRSVHRGRARRVYSESLIDSFATQPRPS